MSNSTLRPRHVKAIEEAIARAALDGIDLHYCRVPGHWAPSNAIWRGGRWEDRETCEPVSFTVCGLEALAPSDVVKVYATREDAMPDKPGHAFVAWERIVDAADMGGDISLEALARILRPLGLVPEVSDERA